jgi:ankyrin repeat protein
MTFDLINPDADDIKTLTVNQFGGNQKDFELYKAVLNRNITAIQTLVAEGANPHAHNLQNGTTTLDLLLHGVRPDRLAAFVSSEKQRRKFSLDILRLFLQKHTTFPNKVYDVELRKTLHTPLCQAVQILRVNSVKLLLEAGANPSTCSKPGCILPLYHALTCRNPYIAHLLLDHGVKQKDSYSVLWESKSTKLLSRFLKEGSDPNATNEFGSSALHFAALCADTGHMRVLLQHGAVINLQDQLKQTPLFAAVFGLGSTRQYIKSHDDCIEAIKFLIENGANYTLKDAWDQYATDRLLDQDKQQIQMQYNQLNKEIRDQLKLGNLDESQQILVAEGWRRLGETKQALLCLLLGLKLPIQKSYTQHLLSFILPSTSLLSPDFLTSSDINSDFYGILKNFPTLPTIVQLKILACLFSDAVPHRLCKDAVTPLINLPEAASSLSFEGFLSILLTQLPLAFKKCSETFMDEIKKNVHDISTQNSSDTLPSPRP